MNYELKNWKQNGSLKDNEDGTSTQPIMVWTKIVGDTYGFEKADATTAIFPTASTIPQATEACQNSAIDFVKTKYPNTK